MSKKRQTAILYPHGDPKAQLTSLSWDYSNGEFVEDHFHEEHQLVFAGKGVMTIQTEKDVWMVPPLRAVWIPGKVVHSIRMSGNVSMRTLYFASKFAQPTPTKCFVMNVPPLLRELILHACERSKLSLKSIKERRIIELILDQIDARNSVDLQLPLPHDKRAKRVAEAMLVDPSDQRQLDEVCKECGASKRTIERLFQDETHMTVGKWRQQLRLLHSLKMLAAGEKVSFVALEAGYSTPSAFISAFRKVLGSTPSNYLS